MGLDKSVTTHIVRQKALDLGFSFVGIAKAEQMNEEAKRLEEWLNKAYHGSMSYMENYFDLRIDPTKLVPGAKSVICLMYNYETDLSQIDPEAPKISKYAYGRDYHKVLKKKLKKLIHSLKEEIGDIHGRAFVDSAPILERDWAKRTGIGWVGKNTLLIHPKAGSYFFLAELICDLELEYDHPIKDYCGTCTKCIDSCPTEAISPAGYVLDASKCISYLTIELKESIPSTFKSKMEDWVFGCDICQEVCPWNRFSNANPNNELEPRKELLEMRKKDWIEITEEIFDKIFQGSAVRRTKYQGLRRNIDFIYSDTQDK